MKQRMAKAILRPRVSEKTEQAHIVQLLRTVGGQVYVMGTTRRRGDHPGTMQTPGIPDVMAFLPVKRSLEQHGAAALESTRPSRVFLFVEVKAAGGRLRAEQGIFRQLCVDADVIHLVGGLDVVIAWLIERRYIAADSVAHYRVPAPEARP